MFTCYKAPDEALGRLYQWDMNRTVFVSADDAPTAPVFHFCSVGDKRALVVTPENVSGGYAAAIPNVLLEKPEAICLYLVSAGGEAVSTDNMAVLPVEPRPKPEDYEYVENSTHIALSALHARVEALLDDWQAELLASQSHRADTGNPHAVISSQVGARPVTWTPSAADVGAELSGTVAAHNEGGEAHSALFAGKADKSAEVEATLAAVSWVGAAAPYTYTLSLSGVTATSNQEILPAVDITQEQLEALQAANIADGGQAAGSITLKAWGDVPDIDLPIRIIKRGDM